jgi:hypothetical protein
VLAVGAVHLQRYEYRYSAIPTIGTLFLLSFAGATALGLGLLAPVERLGGRLGGLAVGLLALGGIGLAGLAADLDRPARPSTGYVLPKRLCRGQRQLARGRRRLAAARNTRSAAFNSSRCGASSPAGWSL